MTTVTGLTADRMLAIEAASVVDGDVDAAGNLILTTKGGTQINAGNVKGPKGDPGPVGQDIPALNGTPVLDVGQVGQIRAGRQLTLADFTNMGLNAPAGLWNLSDLSDVSGNGRNLSNKGAVPFDFGINGVAASAAKFLGAVGQVLYIPDTGVADPFKLRTGSVGCWFRTAKFGAYNILIDKYAAVGQQNYSLYVNTTGQLVWSGSSDGSANNMFAQSLANVADDRWHFGVGTYDGEVMRVYVDGTLDGMLLYSFPSLAPTNSVLNIGGRSGDAANNTTIQNWGRVDEAFITQDVLSDDEVRNLYCAKIVHTLGALPTRINLNVRRRRRGATLAVNDFTTQPLRLHNFSAGSLGDEGSNNTGLTNNGSCPIEAAADGLAGNAFGFGGGTQNLSSSDTGLPAALATRSYGAWFKASAATETILSWGTFSTGDVRIRLPNGTIACNNVGDAIVGPYAADGAWHHVVMVEDNASADGIKRKMYLDGRLVAVSGGMNPIVLSGANRFRIASAPDGTLPFAGQIDGVFVCDYALTIDQIRNLYNKSSQTLAPSPKNTGDHVEACSAADLLVTFDSLEPNSRVDLVVA